MQSGNEEDLGNTSNVALFMGMVRVELYYGKCTMIHLLIHIYRLEINEPIIMCYGLTDNGS